MDPSTTFQFLRHDIAEILLKVVLNTKNQINLLLFFKKLCNNDEMILGSSRNFQTFETHVMYKHWCKIIPLLLGLKRLSWSWSYGSWIYNYLCNQSLLPLKLWVQTLFMARCMIQHCYKVCQWLVTDQWFSATI